MSDVEPFDLGRAQNAVKGAADAARPRHMRWRFFEELYRWGDVARAAQTVSGDVAELFDKDTWSALPDVANMVLPHVTVIEGSVTARDPALVATPIEGGERAEAAASTVQGVLGYFWPRVEATPRIAKATHDMLVVGNGVVKVGWMQQTEEEDVPAEEQDDELAREIEAETVMAELERREPRSEVTLRKNVATRRGRVLRDEPYVEYVSPYDFFVDSAATDLDDARWVAQRLTLPVDEVEANDEYSQAAKDELSAIVVDQHDHEGTERHAEWTRRIERPASALGGWETVTVWEFYDMRARRLLIFAEDAEESLYDEEFDWDHRHSGFVHLPNQRMSGTDFWGFSDVEAVASLQQQLNDLLTEQLDNARRSGNKYFVDQDAWSEEVRDGLASDMPEEVIPIGTATGVPVRDLVYSVERKPLDADIYQARVDVQEYMRLVMGIDMFQGGAADVPDRLSATAASIVDSVSSVRAAAKAFAVERGVARAGQILLLLAQEWMEPGRAIRISGQSSEGAEWTEVSPDDLWGEFRVTVESGSMRAENPATQEKRGMQLLTEVAPMMAELGMDPMPSVRSGLRDLGYDPDLLVQPAQQPPDGAAPPAPGPAGAGPPGEGAPAAVGSPGALDAQLAGAPQAGL